MEAKKHRLQLFEQVASPPLSYGVDQEEFDILVEVGTVTVRKLDCKGRRTSVCSRGRTVVAMATPFPSERGEDGLMPVRLVLEKE